MHASALEACPMTTVLQQLGMDAGVVKRLHERTHRDPHNGSVARDLLDCLESIVRAQQPPPAQECPDQRVAVGVQNSSLSFASIN
jgi:hypothetical protein